MPFGYAALVSKTGGVFENFSLAIERSYRYAKPPHLNCYFSNIGHDRLIPHIRSSLYPDVA